MRKSILISGMLLLVGGLSAGCGSVKVSPDGNNVIIGKDKNSVKKSESISKSKSMSISASKSSSEAKQEQLKEEIAKTTWTEKKDAHLEDAMQTLAKKRKVTYEKYNGRKSLKVADQKLYPDTFKKDNFYLNGKKISIGWSPQGGDTYAYKVMAIYNQNLGGKKGYSTFLFCLHDKKPIVLVDTNQLGKKVNLTVSNDKSMTANFSDVMDGDL